MEHQHSIPARKLPDYDFHMPAQFRFPLPIVIISASLAGLTYFLLHASQPILAAIAAGLCLLAGGIYVGIFAMLTRITNLDRRLGARDRLLDEIPWQGNETVLDVGVGNGILLLGAARRLTTGSGIGIDLWTEGSGDNRPEAFRENARIENVAERVSLHNEDARQLPYEDEAFDVILSGLTMHHLGFDTEKAMAEMTRVLKPGGWMAIYDEPSTVFYCARLMRQYGLKIEKKSVDIVFGVKPCPSQR